MAALPGKARKMALNVASASPSLPAGAARAARPSVVRLGLSRVAIELKVYFRNAEMMFFTFLLPILFLFIFASVFSGDINAGPGVKVNFTNYFLPGIIASGVMSATFASLAISIAIEQHEGMLKRLAGTPLPKASYFIGKLGLAVVVTLAQTAIMLVAAILLYGVELPAGPDRWAVFLSVLVLSAATGAVLGIAYTRLVPNAKSAPAIIQPPFLILQFISGVFFRYGEIPGWLQAIASIFPLKWMSLGFRYAFLPDSFGKFEYGADWGWERPILVLTAWLVAGFVLALLFFRWDRQRE